MMQRKEKVIRYRDHAEHRMAERGISKSQVERTLKNPDKTGPAQRPGATKYEKAISKKVRVRVIADEFPNEIWVITAWK